MSLLQFTLGWRFRSWRASSLPAHKVVVARLELQVLARIRVVSGGSGFEPAGPRSISCWSNSGRARRFPAVSGGFRRFPAVLVLNRPVTDLFHCGPSRVPPGSCQGHARQVLASVPIVGAQLSRGLMIVHVTAAIHSWMAFQKLARIQSVGT